jgi:hypothetical protein
MLKKRILKWQIANGKWQKLSNLPLPFAISDQAEFSAACRRSSIAPRW